MGNFKVLAAAITCLIMFNCGGAGDKTEYGRATGSMSNMTADTIQRNINPEGAREDSIENREGVNPAGNSNISPNREIDNHYDEVK